MSSRSQPPSDPSCSEWTPASRQPCSRHPMLSQKKPPLPVEPSHYLQPLHETTQLGFVVSTAQNHSGLLEHPSCMKTTLNLLVKVAHQHTYRHTNHHMALGDHTGNDREAGTGLVAPSTWAGSSPRATSLCHQCRLWTWPLEPRSQRTRMER